MATRPALAFSLVFLANVVWDDVLGLLLFKHAFPDKDLLLFVIFWLLPFVAYLAVLYKTGVFVRGQRVLRAATLCVVSFIAAHLALGFAEVLGAVVSIILHGVPKPMSLHWTGSSRFSLVLMGSSLAAASRGSCSPV